MKKTIIAIALSLMPLAASAQWNRINVGLDYAWQEMPLQFDGWLLNRPGRSVHLNVGYRLWQHWEVGVYIGVQNGNLYNGGTSSYRTPQGERYDITYMDVTKGIEWTTGVLVQYHILPFSEGAQRMDGMFRLGFTPGGAEIDNFWGGMGISYKLSQHLSLLLNCDIGSFRPGRLINHVLEYDEVPVRTSVGVQVQL